MPKSSPTSSSGSPNRRFTARRVDNLQTRRRTSLYDPGLTLISRRQMDFNAHAARLPALAPIGEDNNRTKKLVVLKYVATVVPNAFDKPLMSIRLTRDTTNPHVRKLAVDFTRTVSIDADPLSSPPASVGQNVGDIHIHRHPGGRQVWVWTARREVGGVTGSWENATDGTSHPGVEMAQPFMLTLRQPDSPEWVTKGTWENHQRDAKKGGRNGDVVAGSEDDTVGAE